MTETSVPTPTAALSAGKGNESLMPPRRSGYVADGAPGQEDNGSDDADYWFSLINEKVAAAFLGLTDRTVQALRQRGSGPRYYFLSSRCLRYRRIDLREWAEKRVRTSTSDPGRAA